MSDTHDKKPRREAPVPEGRGQRVGKLGSMLLGIASDTAMEALRRAIGRGDDGGLLLNTANAKRLTETLADLRGAAMKLGQMLSLQGDDLLPPQFVEVLSTLRDQAFFMPEEQVRSVLERELGTDWESHFQEFDFEPIAAASIGQVHAAETADGRDVAVKIQYPGVRGSVDSDVDNLALVLRISRILPPELEYESLIPEVKAELKRESDYRREAESTKRYQALLGYDPLVFVPTVHDDLSNDHVLVTDRIYGLPIDDLRGVEHPQKRRNRIGAKLTELALREVFEFRFMQTDPNFGNYMYEPKMDRVALLDFGATRSFDVKFTEAYRQLVIASVERDARRLLDAAEILGLVDESTDLPARMGMVEACELFGEPLREPGPYDFAARQLPKRLREHGMEIFMKHRLPTPPPDVPFMHRKLLGGLLLNTHIGAVVDAHALYRRWVLEPAG